ncbi:MAG: PIN domain-containing protein [Thermofilum sp.]
MPKCYEAVLDTSSILFAVDRKVDIVDLTLQAQVPVCRIIIPAPVLQEIKFLAEKGKGSRAVKAAVALAVINQMLEKWGKMISIVDPGFSERPVDDIVIEAARAEGKILVTADRKMRKRARELGVKVYLVAKASLRLL